MKVLFYTVILIMISSSTACSSKISSVFSFLTTPPSESTTGFGPKIVNGTPATIEETPFQVSLSNKTFIHICGGSLISPMWVLTAAHCVYGATGNFTVKAGIMFLSDIGIARTPVQIIIHENYDPLTFNNDIALLKINPPFPITPKKIETITLPPANFEVPVGTLTQVTGWGALKEDGDASIQLQKVTLSTISYEDCKDLYKPSNNYVDKSTMLCTYEKSKDACQGDSGGPLITHSDDGNVLLLGIVSWGVGCAQDWKPGVYTNVPHFRKWISSITGI